MTTRKASWRDLPPAETAAHLLAGAGVRDARGHGAGRRDTVAQISKLIDPASPRCDKRISTSCGPLSISSRASARELNIEADRLVKDALGRAG
jgi:hypothetical protein